MVDSMDIKTPEGSPVRFTGSNGRDHQKELAKAAGLVPGDIYIVSKVEVHDWFTDVWLDGFDEHFNSVQFSNV
jgi:hypothetical protein